MPSQKSNKSTRITQLEKEEAILLEKLRTALFCEERKRIVDVQHILADNEELSKRIDPIIEAHLEELKQHFPESYVRVTRKIVDQRLKESQNELVDIIYPRLGLMIKKYIARQFKLLRENIDKQIRQSPFSFIMRNRRKVTDEIILDLNPFQIQEVYIISRDSGLLICSVSASETADKDMIAGMLTAIKAFVKDAFLKKDEELSAIQYREYEIIIHNFFNYYIAVAISGTPSEADRSQLTQNILEFADKELSTNLQNSDPLFEKHLNKQLSYYFIEPKRLKENTDDK